MYCFIFFSSSRCDSKMDCPDFSDEAACNFLDICPMYMKELVPKPQSGDPLDVGFSIFINSIPYIDTYNLKFTVNFYIKMEWADDR